MPVSAKKNPIMPRCRQHNLQNVLNRNQPPGRLGVRFHFNRCGWIVEDAVYLLNPGIKGAQVFPVLVGAVVAGGFCPLVNEIENNRRCDVDHTHITGKFVEPLQTYFFSSKVFWGKLTLQSARYFWASVQRARSLPLEENLCWFSLRRFFSSITHC